MSMGIEHFRSLVTEKSDLENRRVTTNQIEGQRELRAPNDFWGRLVHWVKGQNIGQQRALENKTARETFYNALVKSEGKAFAERIIQQTTGLTGDEFKARTTNLQASKIKQILDTSDKLHDKFVLQTERGVQRFLEGGNLVTAARLLGPVVGHPNLRTDDPELTRAFLDLVRMDPDFGHKQFTVEDFAEIARKAVGRCCQNKHARFDEQHPHLAGLDNGHFHDLETYFGALVDDLGRPPLDAMPQDFKDTVSLSLQDIRHANRQLARMEFGPEQAQQLKTDIGQALESLVQWRALLEHLPLLGQGEGYDKARALRDALGRELDLQIEKLAAKAEFIDEYLQHDPLSDKSVAYDKLIWTQATKLVLEDVMQQLLEKVDEVPPEDDAERQRLLDKRNMIIAKSVEVEDRINVARENWQQAGLDRTVAPKSMLGQRHALKTNRSEELDFLKSCYDEAMLIPKGAWSPFPTKWNIAPLLDKMQIKALDTIQDWHVISRDMVVSRDGVTRTYRSVITPGSKVGGVVGKGYEQDGLQGVSAGNKTERSHARNLQVSELYRVEIDPQTGEERTVKLSQTVRHGVLDPWDIPDKDERTLAQQSQAREVLTTVVEINPEFKQEAIRKQQEGNLERSKIVHVNLNLTTADNTILRKLAKDHREGDFTLNQFEAFESFNGETNLVVETINEQDVSEEIDITFDIDTITFSFGVNEVAMGEGIWALSGEETLWGLVEEHDRQNLIKLVGDLTLGTAPGGYIGDIVDWLRAEAEDPNTTLERRNEINEQIGVIRREVDVARDLFNSGAFKHRKEDAYKMVRTVMRVVDLGAQGLQMLGDNEMLLSLSQGCKSNKDRGGMGDVENKAQTIIEDMGGRVEPGQTFELQDQIIYNTVLTSSGQVEVQQMNTGLPGSMNVGGLRERIGNSQAFKYARGFSKFARS